MEATEDRRGDGLALVRSSSTNSLVRNSTSILVRSSSTNALVNSGSKEAPDQTLTGWKRQALGAQRSRSRRGSASMAKIVQLRMDTNKAQNKWTKLAKAAIQGSRDLRRRSLKSQASTDTRSVDDTESGPGDNRNFSSDLFMTHLEDGIFRAEMLMTAVPSGDLAIHIKDYTLEIHIQRRTPDASTQLQQQQQPTDAQNPTETPKYCGCLCLPIFVDPATVDFFLNEDKDVMVVMALIKGYHRYKSKESQESSVLNGSFTNSEILSENNTFLTKPRAVLTSRRSSTGGLHTQPDRHRRHSLAVTPNMATRPTLIGLETISDEQVPARNNKLTATNGKKPNACVKEKGPSALLKRLKIW